MKQIFYAILILLFCTLTAFVLNYFAFSIDTTNIRSNVEKSVFILREEGAHTSYAKFPKILSRIYLRDLDNWTDSTMIFNTFYKNNESTLKQSIIVYHPEYDDSNPTESIIKYFDNTSNMKEGTYPRYWHGYLTILKPVFNIIDYGQIRFINLLLQPILFLVLCAMMYKRELKSYIIPLIISIFVIYPLSTPLSLQFSAVYYITILSMILMLVFEKQLKNLWIYFFLLIGIITCYLDFLTYPLVTLGLPLILYTLKENNKKQAIKNIFLFSIFWAFGYLGMFFTKWIFASMLINENIFTESFNQMLYRCSNIAINEPAPSSFTVIDVLKSNLKYLFRIPYVFVWVAVIIVNVSLTKKKDLGEKISSVLPLIIISAYPIFWFALTQNHSIIHCDFYSYKILWITVFAILCAFTSVRIYEK